MTAIFLLSDPLYLRAPKDDELIFIFAMHRQEFEQLSQLAIQDSSVESYFSASHLDDRLGEARKREYDKLLSEIRTGLVVTTSGQSVRFIFASGGLSAIGPGWLKGIEFLPGDSNRGGQVKDDLDRPASLPEGGVYLRMIQPKWYIVLQKID